MFVIESHGELNGTLSEQLFKAALFLYVDLTYAQCKGLHVRMYLLPPFCGGV